MKNKLSLILALAAALLFNGCSTNGIQPENIAPFCELAAYDGALIYLSDNKDQIPKFELVVENLDYLLAQGVTFQGFVLVVKQLPLDKLQNDRAQLIVDNAIILFNAYGKQIVQLQALEQAQKLEPIVVAVRDGLARAVKISKR